MGMLAPSAFGHVLTSAGDSYFSYLYKQLIPVFIRNFEKYGSIDQMVEVFKSEPQPSSKFNYSFFQAIMLLNMCQCYIPNSDMPYGVELFFDEHTGALKPELWKKLLAWDPISLIATHEDALRSLNSLSLFAGTHDQYGLHLGHRQISQKLRSKGIAHDIIEYQEGHTGIYYRTIDHIKHMIDMMGIVAA